MTVQPKPGLVIRYDYLWKREHDAGRIDGAKDRPCAIIVSTASRAGGGMDVVLCAITHSPPQSDGDAVEIPHDVARRIGLDEQRSWIVTQEVNTVVWENGRMPFGVSPVKKGQWAFGTLPRNLGKLAFDQLASRIKAGGVAVVRRKDD